MSIKSSSDQQIEKLEAERETLIAALRGLVDTWKREADEADQDGDFCCAATRRNDANALKAALASVGDPHE